MTGSEASVLFIRHGETAYNRRGVRCGGDIDIPLTEDGRRQALLAAERLRDYAGKVDVILAAPLMRTLMTAEIVAPALGNPPIIPHPGLTERRLGAWNGMPVEATQPLIDRGETPDGGESESLFRRRIAAMLADILARRDRLPLLVGSKGVARMMRLLLHGDAGAPLHNAECLHFVLSDGGRRALEREAARSAAVDVGGITS